MLGLAFGLIFTISNLSTHTWVLPLRDHEKISETLKASIPGSEIVESSAKEFDDGNTFARITTPLSQKRVVIGLPQKMLPHILMEALIKIRIAKSEGAAEIVVWSPVGLGQLQVIDSQGTPIHLPISQWLAVAGASISIEGNSFPQQISKVSSPKVDSFPHAKTFICGNKHPEMVAGLSKYLTIPSIKESSVLSDVPPGSRLVYVVPSQIPVNETLFQALSSIWTWSLRGISVQLVTPYLFYARSDKIDQSGTAIVGRLVADLIESVGTSTISFIRAHAPQSEGFFSIPTVHVSGRETINKFLLTHNIDGVVSPDAGFQKQATLYANDLGVGISVINKQRDPTTGKLVIHGVSGNPVKNRRLALIDDETQTGGTLHQGSEHLKKRKATFVIAIVTNLAGNGDKAMKSPFIDIFAATNSLPVSAEVRSRTVILDIIPELGDAIRPLILSHGPLPCFRMVGAL